MHIFLTKEIWEIDRISPPELVPLEEARPVPVEHPEGVVELRLGLDGLAHLARHERLDKQREISIARKI